MTDPGALSHLEETDPRTLSHLEEAVPLLQMSAITKRFPGVLANDGVDFDVAAGEVHALFGENGAGKSTLMRVLYGLYRPDEGKIAINGKATEISSPAAAIRQGIGMIHQHFMLVNTLTVVENIALGLKSSRGPLTDLRRVAKRVRELADSHGLKVSTDALVWQLSVGERQRVEILKALYRDANILVLDEPTAVLTPNEVDDLFRVLRQLAAAGRGLVFISHKVNEVLELSDRITVLRAGRRVGTLSREAASRESLVEMMVGHDISAEIRQAPAAGGDKRLVLAGLTVRGDRGQEAVRGVDLTVESGEIVGIAGVSGNGQRELAEAIAGIRAPEGGSALIDGKEVLGAPPDRVRAAGLAYVPEERMRDGIVPDFSVAENLMLVESGRPPFSHLGFLRARTIRRHCQKLVEEFAVKTPSLDTPARNLSGGNIQKLIMARELSGRPRVLLVAQPTRGIDVGAATYIHKRLVEQRDAGTAVLIISEDLDEVMSLSDRILVMFEGRVIGTADPRTSTREAVGLLMAGVVPS
ncbi:MAG: ABC transporter ATP-binding protein [Actinomycetota bacterium]|jgi:simple sugar transport system ATP-binding protein|nr:ABC transporter ATP-binding protein [Actinomycetota bacterium]